MTAATDIKALQARIARTPENTITELTQAEVAALQAQIAELEHIANAKQAKIDSLMLEYCPDEMTPEQMDDWARHQRPCDIKLEAMVAAQAREPVARLIHWNGPAHGYIPANCVSARTFTEFSKEDCEKAKHYWKEGELLYTSPPAPASLSLVRAALEAAKQAVKERAVSDEIFVENAVDAIDGIDPQTIINEASK